MIEPIFEAVDFIVLDGRPKLFDQVSQGSKKKVHVNFCSECGTKLWLRFERFPDAVGIYAGTFDNPTWFPLDGEGAKHIFLGVARPDTIIPAGIPTYIEHAIDIGDKPQKSTVFEDCHRIGSQ